MPAIWRLGDAHCFAPGSQCLVSVGAFGFDSDTRSEREVAGDLVAIAIGSNDGENR